VFVGVELARKIEGAEARLSADIAESVQVRRPGSRALIEAVAGGVAVFTGPSSPINKMIGVGFEGLPEPARLDQVERLFAARGSPVQAEVSTLADPALHALLSARGYILIGFENVMVKPLGTADRSVAPAGFELRPIDESDTAFWATMLVDGFSTPDAQGVPAEQLPPRGVLEELIGDMTDVPDQRRYAVFHEGVMVAGASMRIDGGIAQLAGSATLPTFRRRGLQTALVRHRLADAAERGCTIAVVTTAPGSKSQENMHRQGFSLGYSRAVLLLEADAQRQHTVP